MPHLFAQFKQSSFTITVSTSHQQLVQKFLDGLVANEDSFFRQSGFKTKIVFKEKNMCIFEFERGNYSSSTSIVRAALHLVLSDFMWKEHWKLVNYTTFPYQGNPEYMDAEWTYRNEEIRGHYN